MSWVDRLTEALLRLFYPVRGLRGDVPQSGVYIVVANHPNGLLDPLMLRLLLGRRVGFLAKSTFWSTAPGRWVMEKSGAMPVYRAHEADTSRNEATFARCRKTLSEGHWLALFPEGKSHSEPTLQPLKSGAARIALSALAEHPNVPLRILPVGLFYEDKAVFRSRAAGRVGEPVEIADLVALHRDDPRRAVTELTERVEAALGAVVLQGESEQLRQAFYAVAGWTLPVVPGSDLATAKRSVAEQEERARTLALAYQRGDDAARARAVAAFETFQRRMDELGVVDPLAVLAPDRGRVLARTLGLLAMAPIAALGALFAWVPYRMIRWIAERLAAGNTDVVGTMKVLVGVAVLAPVYVGEAVAMGAWQGWIAGLAMALIGPLTGFVALRFDERVTVRVKLLRGVWLGSDARAAVDQERAALIAAVSGAGRAEDVPVSA